MTDQEVKEMFFFNDNWKNIGIKLSGGADSAIMYYVICDYYKDRDDVNIYPMSLDTKFKPWYSESAKRVIEKVTEITGKAPKKHIIQYDKRFCSPKTIRFYIEGQEQMLANTFRKYNLQVSYNGLTSNPPEKEMLKVVKRFHKDEKTYQLAERRIVGRDTSRDSRNITRHSCYSDGSLIINIKPFVYKDKKITYELYKYYNRLNDLYPLTYSCETRWQDYKLKKLSEHNWNHCGYCFFCSERYYAFGRLI